jgi:hypothetical protein
MADVDGEVAVLGDPVTSTRGGFPGDSSSLSQGSATPTRKFQMRGWSTTHSGWRTWISYSNPQPIPPAEYGVVTGVTTTALWE